MQKLILKSFLSPGDVLMLTAAVRDLHLNHPGQFVTDVRTSASQLWENNPYLTPLEDDDPDVRIIDMEYPLIQRSNLTPHHFIHGFGLVSLRAPFGGMRILGRAGLRGNPW